MLSEEAMFRSMLSLHRLQHQQSLQRCLQTWSVKSQKGDGRSSWQKRGATRQDKARERPPPRRADDRTAAPGNRGTSHSHQQIWDSTPQRGRQDSQHRVQSRPGTWTAPTSTDSPDSQVASQQTTRENRPAWAPRTDRPSTRQQSGSRAQPRPDSQWDAKSRQQPEASSSGQSHLPQHSQHLASSVQRFSQPERRQPRPSAASDQAWRQPAAEDQQPRPAPRRQAGSSPSRSERSSQQVARPSWAHAGETARPSPAGPPQRDRSERVILPSASRHASAEPGLSHGHRPLQSQQMSNGADQPRQHPRQAPRPVTSSGSKDPTHVWFFATCHPGLEASVEQELCQPCIGAERVTSGKAGVSFMCAAASEVQLALLLNTYNAAPT